MPYIRVYSIKKQTVRNLFFEPILYKKNNNQTKFSLYQIIINSLQVGICLKNLLSGLQP